MKEVYIRDLHARPAGSKVVLFGWISAKRCQGKVIFLDIRDSTGLIQAVIEETPAMNGQFELFKSIPVETAVAIGGTLRIDHNHKEIGVTDIHVIGNVTKPISPSPRSNIDIFSPKLADHLLTHRHLYLRNPKFMAIMRFRDALMRATREWFYTNSFLAIDAPVLTPVPLYEDRSAIAVDIHGDKIFLTQCVGYYLEAAVHAFERVYNMGPSFRGEESHSKRHLMEYWHIKAEATWTNLDDIMTMVEQLLKHILEKCAPELEEAQSALGRQVCLDGANTPFERITYEDALALLNKQGAALSFGKSLGSDEETALSKIIGKPFWVSGIPRSVEPFPYVVDPVDSRITRVADLIASNGFGELLGTAEKIHDHGMLVERMKEKGKDTDTRYRFVHEVHEMGCVPHSAFGMGVERLIRWILNIPHVRDAIPFPRTFRRKVSP